MEGCRICSGKFRGNVCNHLCKCMDLKESKNFRFPAVWKEIDYNKSGMLCKNLNFYSKRKTPLVEKFCFM